MAEILRPAVSIHDTTVDGLVMQALLLDSSPASQDHPYLSKHLHSILAPSPTL